MRYVAMVRRQYMYTSTPRATKNAGAGAFGPGRPTHRIHQMYHFPRNHRWLRSSSSEIAGFVERPTPRNGEFLLCLSSSFFSFLLFILLLEGIKIQWWNWRHKSIGVIWCNLEYQQKSFVYSCAYCFWTNDSWEVPSNSASGIRPIAVPQSGVNIFGWGLRIIHDDDETCSKISKHICERVPQNSELLTWLVCPSFCSTGPRNTTKSGEFTPRGFIIKSFVLNTVCVLLLTQWFGC